MNQPFPNCLTCRWLDDQYDDSVCTLAYDDNEGTHRAVSNDMNVQLWINDPEKFFCSEHETINGERFVNWGTK